ncbi:MAG: acyltransferase family protein, partial [Chloroflexota bacterium]
TSLIFSEGWFHIKNMQTHYFFNVVIGFIYIWHMPLFFFIAGASSAYALKKRTAAQYRKERVYRLLIPLIFGIVLLIPPQSYFENIQKAGYGGSFLEFYPAFFNGLYPTGNLHWGHLWFLFYLFVFSLVLSGLVSALNLTEQNIRVHSFITRLSERNNIFYLAVPLILIEFSLRWRFSGFQTFITDWANVLHYLLLVIFGFLIYSSNLLVETISQCKTKALFAAIPCSIAFLVLIPISIPAFAEYRSDPSLQNFINHPEILLFYILVMGFKVLAEWFWLIAILGYARKYLSSTGSIMQRLSRMAFPFYIFHQTIIISIGFFVVQYPLSIWLKYTIISLLAIPLTYACCELAKQQAITRFIFGIK